MVLFMAQQTAYQGLIILHFLKNFEVYLTPSVFRFESFWRENFWAGFQPERKYDKKVSNIAARCPGLLYVSMNKEEKMQNYFFLDICEYCNNISFYHTCSNI